MLDTRRLPIARWTVDYGDGSRPSEVILPHAWRQDVSVLLEGPVTYRTQIGVPRGRPHLLFRGVSYFVEIHIDGELVATHAGMWDAFFIELHRWAGKGIEVEVRVWKNGGERFPVRDVASGFLPFVFQTFGGLHGMVELCHDRPRLELAANSSRVSVVGSEIYLDGVPFYIRGLLHWGWFPEVGHTNPPDDVIRQEVRDMQRLGFNLVKFCLWVPSHRYLEILEEEGMVAWMELPLWDPSDAPEKLAAMRTEMETIVRQYRHHTNIIVWTVGCELGQRVPAEFRQELTQAVRNLTGCPLVKDNSGGSEMYEADLREFGDFYDFHPYCDTPFYPQVLDSLLPGPREERPVLLGEFNDVDVHRDLSRLGDELPFWASNLPELNDRGVRWQHDLPDVLDESRFALHPSRSRHSELMESSRQKALFIRKTVQEQVRERSAIGGYVITGWRDTPISTAGFFDDWGNLRFSEAECRSWNGEEVLFLIPARRPPWVDGGNRAGYRDPFNHFAGDLHLRVGVHSVSGGSFGLTWRLESQDGDVVARGASSGQKVEPLTSREIGEVFAKEVPAGEYRLFCEAAGAKNYWPIWVVDRLEASELVDWRLEDPDGMFTGLPFGDGPNLVTTEASSIHGEGKRIAFLSRGAGLVRAPFWRESAYEFRNEGFWAACPFAHQWSRLMAVSGDRFLSPDGLQEHGLNEVVMNRVDTRSYRDAPVIARGTDRLVTTLRPYGGLGNQPTSILRNPAGVALLRVLLRLA